MTIASSIGRPAIFSQKGSRSIQETPTTALPTPCFVDPAWREVLAMSPYFRKSPVRRWHSTGPAISPGPDAQSVRQIVPQAREDAVHRSVPNTQATGMRLGDRWARVTDWSAKARPVCFERVAAAGRGGRARRGRHAPGMIALSGGRPEHRLAAHLRERADPGRHRRRQPAARRGQHRKDGGEQRSCCVARACKPTE